MASLLLLPGSKRLALTLISTPPLHVPGLLSLGRGGARHPTDCCNRPGPLGKVRVHRRTRAWAACTGLRLNRLFLVRIEAMLRLENNCPQCGNPGIPGLPAADRWMSAVRPVDVRCERASRAA